MMLRKLEYLILMQKGCKMKKAMLSSNTVKIENFDASKIYDFRTLRVWDPKKPLVFEGYACGI